MALARGAGTLKQYGDIWAPTATSPEWQSGYHRAGATPDQINFLTDYWDNNPYLNSIYNFASQGLANPLYSPRRVTKNNNPMGYYMDQGRHDKYAKTIDYTIAQTRNTDPFKSARDYTMNNGVAMQGDVSGQVLNNAFISDADFSGLSEDQKKYYGLTYDQYAQNDPYIGAAGNLLEAGIGHRNAANRGKGLSGAVKKAVGFGLPLAGLAIPALGPGLGALNTLRGGGDLGDLVKSFGKSYLNSIIPTGTDALKGLGFAQQLDLPEKINFGTDSMSIFDSLKNFGGDLFNNFDIGGFLDGPGGTPAWGGGGGYGGTQGINPGAPPPIGGWNPGSTGPLGGPVDYGGSVNWGKQPSGVLSTLGNILTKPIGGGDNGSVLSTLFNYLGAKEGGDAYERQVGNAAEGAQFNPYNVYGPGGAGEFVGNSAIGTLSPERQQFVDILKQISGGALDNVSTADPYTLANEQMGRDLEYLNPYREREVERLLTGQFGKGTLGSINESYQDPESGEYTGAGNNIIRTYLDSVQRQNEQLWNQSLDRAYDYRNQDFDLGIGSLTGASALEDSVLELLQQGSDLGGRGAAAGNNAGRYLEALGLSKGGRRTGVFDALAELF